MSSNHVSLENKFKPAYDGARFDKSGFCLKHPMVRLCKPVTTSSTSQSVLSPHGERVEEDIIKYVVIRKICHLCGEHSLRNERKLDAKVSVNYWLKQ